MQERARKGDMAKVPAYDEPLAVWDDDRRVVAIKVKYPALPEPAKVLAALGEPDAKLDYYYASVPKLNEGGEWVWARRGLTLFLSKERTNAIALLVCPPTTVERYRAELHVEERPEER